MRKIKSKNDWEWYVKELDVNGRYSFRHNNEPERFPCIVHSEHWDDPNGPYTYFHSFYYLEDHACESCGHVSSSFPLSAEQLKEVVER